MPVRVAYAMTYHHPYPGTHNTYPFAGFQLRMLDQYGLWDVRTSPMFIVRADWKVVMAGSRNFRLGRNTAGDVYLSFDRPSQSRPGQFTEFTIVGFSQKKQVLWEKPTRQIYFVDPDGNQRNVTGSFLRTNHRWSFEPDR